MGSGPSLNGFNFEGLGKGRLRIDIPVNWTVHVTCANLSSLHHSCGVVEGAQTSQLAFPGAATPSPTVGVPPGQSASFTFVADRTGSFRITCLVPGHMEAGMWASLEISTAGSPSVSSV
jgi:FtsP/CotA-like multicopper oxidase with cupredoxin domain